jgi:hypothetical protein
METGRLIVGSKDDAQGFLSSCSGHYVYILRRPEGRPFYVGKGKGSRVFQHENEARHPGNYPKLNVIRAIWKNAGIVQYEIDSVFETAAEAYAREATLILAFKRLHEGGPLTNLAPGGGTDAGISPISKEKHRVTLGGVPTDDPDLAVINQYLLSIGDVRSICVKVAARYKVKPTQPYPAKGVGNTQRQAYALIASASANSIMLEAGCVIPRLFTIEGVTGIMENGVCCDYVTSGMANLIPHPDPRLEQFTLSAKQIAVIERLVGNEKLRDLGLVA